MKEGWGGNRYKLGGPGGPEGGPGRNVVCVFAFPGSIIICLLHKLTLSAQAQVTLQLTVILSDFV
jgi:hypothetical protein